MKALTILFHMRYGSLLSSMKWLSDRPKCWGHLVEARTTQRATKLHKVWCGLKCIKSVIFSENVGQLLNLGYLETTKSNFKKIDCFMPVKPNLEKGWFGSEQNNCTLWVCQTQRVPEPFGLSPGHFLELSKLWYLIWKRGVWAICWLKKFEFFQPNRYFLNLFLSGSRVYHRSSRFWSLTQSLPWAYGATMPHMQGEY